MNETKYPRPSGYGSICGKCSREVGIVFIGIEVIPVDIAPDCYRRYNGKKTLPLGEKEGFSKSWLNGVDYSLKHKCNNTNYKVYEDEADKIGNYQR